MNESPISFIKLPFVNDIECDKENRIRFLQNQLYKNQIELNKLMMEEAKKECEEIGHVWTWMPHDAKACYRCGIIQQKIEHKS